LKNPEQYFSKKACRVEKEFVLRCGPTEEDTTSEEGENVDDKGSQLYNIHYYVLLYMKFDLTLNLACTFVKLLFNIRLF